MVEAITATYMQDNGDWTVQVAGLGKEVEGKAPGIIAARDRADQLVEKLVPEGSTPTVVHLLNGSALEFTTAYMTARLSRTETVETPEDTSEAESDESVATDEATATDAEEPADSDEAEQAETETADDATEQATTDTAEPAEASKVTEVSEATDSTEAADTTSTVEAADTAGEAAEDGDEAPEIEAEVPTQDTQADADSTARAGKRAVPRKELSTAVGGKVAAAYGKRATG